MTDDRQVWLVRHGATEWSRSGQHTSTTDLPLLPDGEQDAQRVAGRLAAEHFDLVLTSPRLRARQTAELAGFPDAMIEDALVEWDYGPGEGLTSVQIREQIPDWRVWTHGAPALPGTPGETPAQVAERLGSVVRRLKETGPHRTLLFGHGHALRAFAALWIDQPLTLAASLPLETGSVSVLGWEKESPALRRWNDLP